MRNESDSDPDLRHGCCENEHSGILLRLMEKYADLPMDLANTWGSPLLHCIDEFVDIHRWVDNRM
ncbi:MAG: hypothetical protein QTN59_19790 [Candidatus Electrothrix communis]|nr:MAG: hypothetical protein QTN59_19790 [Candidatus Electrothrix communis]